MEYLLNAKRKRPTNNRNTTITGLLQPKSGTELTERKPEVPDMDGHVYFINGTKVPFPVKAYPTQITMMNKVQQIVPCAMMVYPTADVCWHTGCPK